MRACHAARRKTMERRKIRRWVAAFALAWGILGAAAAFPAAAKSKTCFPLQTDRWRVSDPYGWRQDPFTGKNAFHHGVDLACAEGTEVLCVQAGVVTGAGSGGSYGNCLRVQHPDGSETRYAHLQYLYVRAGEVVAAGQRLGTAGQTGRATGAHLHFELRRGGEAEDPAALLELAHAP